MNSAFPWIVTGTSRTPFSVRSREANRLSAQSVGPPAFYAGESASTQSNSMIRTENLRMTAPCYLFAIFLITVVNMASDRPLEAKPQLGDLVERVPENVRRRCSWYFCRSNLACRRGTGLLARYGAESAA
jgi:hypothetical protein